MRQWYACVCRSHYSGANSWHNLKLYAFFHEGFGFFAASAENEWVAALEPHDFAAALRLLDYEFGDFVLWNLMFARAVANVDFLGLLRC
jgi:hypothetical protein